MKALVISAGGGIGDVLLATPVMRALRSRYDEVIALTTPAHEEVLAHDPDLAEVWTDEARFDELTARVARARFDAAIVTWATLRTAALPFAARIPRRVGQARRPYSILFTERVVVRSELGDQETHWTQILLDFARALDCDLEDATPVFRIAGEDEAEAERLLRELAVPPAFMLFHPTRGISSERDNWPEQHLGALARSLSERYGWRALVSGTKNDRRVCEFVAAACGGISIAGLTSLGAFAALAGRSRLTVAMDSGPMHIAAAVGAPTAGIFAMQCDEPDRWRPLGPCATVVLPSYPCPPEHRKETCPDFACVAKLPFSDVAAASDRALELARVRARG